MLYLSGAVRPECFNHPRMGLMLTPAMGNRPDVSKVKWAADNGCFTKPELFCLPAYERWLLSWPSRPLFATAPDRVGNAAETLRVSLPCLDRIRNVAPVALVGQDGQESLPVPWDDIDALFIGGSTEWKLSIHAQRLIYRALELGKWCHMGRVNSRPRFLAAWYMGCHSVDGTFLAFGPDKNWPRLRSWFTAHPL